MTNCDDLRDNCLQSQPSKLSNLTSVKCCWPISKSNLLFSPTEHNKRRGLPKLPFASTLDTNCCYGWSRQRSWLILDKDGECCTDSEDNFSVSLLFWTKFDVWWALVMPIGDVKLSTCQAYSTKTTLGAINFGRIWVQVDFQLKWSSLSIQAKLYIVYARS